ncbi:hypothetical protein SPFM14_00270 [Salmonella phage SPFM14]|nr:hypothetical protein SPFM14_00270 [Salmonella phage SPFM14]
MTGVNAYNTMATSGESLDMAINPIFGKCLLDFVRIYMLKLAASLFASKAPQATVYSYLNAQSYSHRELNERQQSFQDMDLISVVTKLGDNANDIVKAAVPTVSGVYTGTAQKRASALKAQLGDAFNGTIHCSHMSPRDQNGEVVAATSFTAVFSEIAVGYDNSLKQLLAILNSAALVVSHRAGNGLGGLSTMLKIDGSREAIEGCLDMFAPREKFSRVAEYLSWGADARPDVSIAAIGGWRDLFVKRLNKQDRTEGAMAPYERQLLLLAAFAEGVYDLKQLQAEIVVSLVDSQRVSGTGFVNMRFTGQKPVVNSNVSDATPTLLDTNQVQVYPVDANGHAQRADFAITVEHSPNLRKHDRYQAAVMPLEDGAVLMGQMMMGIFGRIAGYLGTLMIINSVPDLGKVLDAEWARTVLAVVQKNIMEAHGLTNANFETTNNGQEDYYTITELFNKDQGHWLYGIIFFERGQSLRLKGTIAGVGNEMGSAAYVAGQWFVNLLDELKKSNEYLNAFRWTVSQFDNAFGIRNISTYAMHPLGGLGNETVKVQTAVPGTSKIVDSNNNAQQNNTQTQDTAYYLCEPNYDCNHY